MDRLTARGCLAAPPSDILASTSEFVAPPNSSRAPSGVGAMVAGEVGTKVGVMVTCACTAPTHSSASPTHARIALPPLMVAAAPRLAPPASSHRLGQHPAAPAHRRHRHHHPHVLSAPSVTWIQLLSPQQTLSSRRSGRVHLNHSKQPHQTTGTLEQYRSTPSCSPVPSLRPSNLWILSRQARGSPRWSVHICLFIYDSHVAVSASSCGWGSSPMGNTPACRLPHQVVGLVGTADGCG